MKKTINILLWVLLSTIVFSVCYTAGIISNWSVSEIFICWMAVLAISVAIRFLSHYLMFNIRKIHSKSYTDKKNKFFMKKIKNGLDNLNGVRRKSSGHPPFYLLLGQQKNEKSLLSSSKLPLFFSINKSENKSPFLMFDWFFFQNMGVLEISENILISDRYVRKITKALTSRRFKKILPSGIVFIIQSDILIKNNTSLLTISQRYRSFAEQLSSAARINIPVYIIIKGCDKIPGFTVLSSEKKPFGIIIDKNSMLYNDYNENISTVISEIKLKVSESIIHRLSKRCSSHERHLLMQLPERINELSGQLKEFLFTFWLSNSYFPSVNLSGIWLVDDSNDNSTHLDTLLSVVLPELSKISHDKNNTATTHIKTICLVLFFLFISYSGFKSYRITDSSGQSSGEICQTLINIDRYKDSLIYLPFYPVLQTKHNELTNKLYQQTAIRLDLIYDISEQYYRKFIKEELHIQRDMILDLSRAITLWLKMKDGYSLSQLYSEYHMSGFMLLSVKSADNSVLQSLAEEMAYINSPGGKVIVRQFRELLLQLIRNDPSYSWILAGHKNMPDIHAADFWQNPSLSGMLPGYWTQQGQNQLQEWFSLIKLALDKNVPSDLYSFINDVHHSRQDKFRQFISEVEIDLRQTAHKNVNNEKRQRLLNQNNTPEIRFLKFIEQELDNIPTNESHVWLTDLRMFNHLLSMENENSLLGKIKQTDFILRMKFMDKIKNNNVSNMNQSLSAWWKWQESYKSAVRNAMSEITSVNIFKNSQSPVNSPGKNNIIMTMFDDFEQFKAAFLSGRNDDIINSILSIYENQLYNVLDAITSNTSCWINKQWKNEVLDPLNNEKGISQSLLQEHVYQQILTFLNKPAQGIINATPSGFILSSFKDRSVEFKTSFMDFLDDIIFVDDLLDIQDRQITHDKDSISNIEVTLSHLDKTLDSLESKPLALTVSTAPVTITDINSVKPTGSVLTLYCATGNSVLKNMNFSERATFTWYPGQCNSVTLKILFPSFDVSYSYDGYSAWHDFIQDFTDGQAELYADNFPEESKNILQHMKIKSILIRYQLSDPRAVNDAYIEWRQLKKDIEHYDTIKTTLMENLSVPSEKTQGWISRIPQDIAECYFSKEF